MSCIEGPPHPLWKDYVNALNDRPGVILFAIYRIWVMASRENMLLAAVTVAWLRNEKNMDSYLSAKSAVFDSKGDANGGANGDVDKDSLLRGLRELWKRCELAIINKIKAHFTNEDEFAILTLSLDLISIAVLEKSQN